MAPESQGARPGKKALQSQGTSPAREASESKGIHPGRKTRHIVVAWPFAGIVFGLTLGWAMHYFYTDAAHARLDEAHQELAQTRRQLADMTRQYDALHGQLAIEASTRKGLEATLATVQDELGAAHDQMAFFDELLPPGPNGAVTIRGLDIRRKGPTLEYRVLLTRRAAGDTHFEGALQFMASGTLEGQPVTLELQPAHTTTADSDEHNGATDTALLGLRFDQFQRSAGVLQLPSGFEPRDIAVHVLQGQAVRATRNVNLADIAPDG